MDAKEIRNRVISALTQCCDGTASSSDPKSWTLELSPSSHDNVESLIELLVQELSQDTCEEPKS